MSEAWDLDEANPELRLLGSSPWIGRWTLNNVLGIDTPELTGSRCAIGMGPGDGAGYIDAYFVGAAYWHY